MVLHLTRYLSPFSSHDWLSCDQPAACLECAIFLLFSRASHEVLGQRRIGISHSKTQERRKIKYHYLQCGVAGKLLDRLGPPLLSGRLR